MLVAGILVVSADWKVYLVRDVHPRAGVLHPGNQVAARLPALAVVLQVERALVREHVQLLGERGRHEHLLRGVAHGDVRLPDAGDVADVLRAPAGALCIVHLPVGRLIERVVIQCTQVSTAQSTGVHTGDGLHTLNRGAKSDFRGSHLWEEVTGQDTDDKEDDADIDHELHQPQPLVLDSNILREVDGGDMVQQHLCRTLCRRGRALGVPSRASSGEAPVRGGAPPGARSPIARLGGPVAPCGAPS
mmetsp:Transcript_17263/g.45667  ORF Transcript_17263/g.45667 Transcript_17263/m.45667 type:complete len:246 (-) Transcript_17263:7-744(-)